MNVLLFKRISAGENDEWSTRKARRFFDWCSFFSSSKIVSFSAYTYVVVVVVDEICKITNDGGGARDNNITWIT